mmetsp:Transcript_2561/g.9741  ORF Transcript_2561/g.9741 Transcript_2561/m.9741 type:complete len:1382 (-) Transcript_2561:564-4709(-)
MTVSTPNDDHVQQIIFYINGKRQVIVHDNRAQEFRSRQNFEAWPDMSLVQYLRAKGINGTKLGCGEGGCGACTVLIQHWNDSEKRIENRSANACLFPLYACHGKHVITVEGIGTYNDKNLHPIQQAFTQFHASQCGFCTPGIIMSLYALLRQNPTPTQDEIEQCVDGNLCRCTGYRPILEAARNWFTHADKNLPLPSEEGSAQSICPSTGKPCNCKSRAKPPPAADSDTNSMPEEPAFCKNLHGAQPIFPTELRSLKFNKTLEFDTKRGRWVAPLSINEMVQLKTNAAQKLVPCKIVVGNTEVGIEMNVLAKQYPIIIHPVFIDELNRITPTETGVSIGSNVTLSNMMRYFKSQIQSASQEDAYKYRPFHAALKQLKWFASTPIRNVASIGGNICTASPISDLNPLWGALNAHVVLENAKGERRNVHFKDFFLGYRKTEIKNDEVLVNLFVPYAQANQYIQAYKQARRREDDIAIVNCSISMHIEKTTESGADAMRLRNPALWFGGMWIHSKHAEKTEEFLNGKILTDNVFEEALQILKEEMKLSPHAPPGQIQYRQALALSFFFKFYMEMKSKVLGEEVDPSSFEEFERPPSDGKQFYNVQKRGTSVGFASKHRTSHVQVTGEALYIDDIPRQNHELHAFMVLSTIPNGKIVNIDASNALRQPGVVDFVSAKDVRGENRWAPGGVLDEEVFISQNVTSVGQIVGLIIAKTQRDAKLAAQHVKVKYEEKTEEAIFAIKEAIERNSFMGEPHVIEMGNVKEAFENPRDDLVLVEGEHFVGGQEHFYLEPQSSIAIPQENDEMTVFSSTQALNKTQHVCADILGVPMHKIVAKTKRIGGGFGGKETRCVLFAAAVSVAARKLNRPVRLILDRQIDIAISGQRHPFFGKYRALVSKNTRKIHALDVELFNNGGYSLDLSLAVMDRAIFHIDNCYHIPNLKVVGRVCKTNLPSNTAFRGFGGPQGMLVTEQIVEQIAHQVGISPHHVREANLYKEGDQTHFGQVLNFCRLPNLWSDCVRISEYEKRVKEVEQFNVTHKYKKRGIALIPTKFGISFTAFFFNQGAALVHIYTDGSILVTHGGVEMGQGLHTKVCQVAASVLGVELERVFCAETSTDKIPNSSPTAASVGSDLYGMAVQDACLRLNERLKPIKEKLGDDATFEQVVQEAYMNRINLSSQGFYKTPGLTMDWEKGRGSPFTYFTYGTACAEVEIDCLTGDHQVIRSDIVMDVGESINPAIDIGQIEGAFVQGYGMFVLEELIRGDKQHPWVRQPGRTVSDNLGFYKVPSFNDIPIELNVHLLPNAPNDLAVMKSKAIGEPPLFLASSVFFAIKHAVQAYREQNNVKEYAMIDSPATAERIRMACTDNFTRHQFESEEEHVKFRVEGSY